MPQQRQPDTCVDSPQGAKGRHMRDPELDHPNPPAGPQHARELGQATRRLFDVTQEIAERDGVERGLGEREPLRGGEHRVRPTRERFVNVVLGWHSSLILRYSCYLHGCPYRH